MKSLLIIVLFGLGTMSSASIASNSDRLDWFWDKLHESIFINDCTGLYSNQTGTEEWQSRLLCTEVRELVKNDAIAPITLASVLIESAN